MVAGVKANKLENSSNMQKMPIMMSKEKITKAISETKVKSRAIAEIMIMDQITHIKDKLIETMDSKTHQVVVEAHSVPVEATPIVAVKATYK